MPGIGRHRDNYPQLRLHSDTHVRVRARLNANTPATVWDPGSGYKFLLKGFIFQITCAGTPDGADLTGTMLSLLDHNANAPILTLGTIPCNTVAKGSHWPGMLAPATFTIAANTPVQEVGGFLVADFKEGIKSATAANILKFGIVDGAATAASVNCGAAGVFILSGVVRGEVVV